MKKLLFVLVGLFMVSCASTSNEDSATVALMKKKTETSKHKVN